MATTSPRTRRLPPAATWSLVAGAYAFLCSTVLMFALSPVSTTVVKLLTLPTEFAAVILAAPTAGTAAVSWWLVVERPRAYTYPRGALAGFSAAVGTVAVWALAYAVVWGVASLVVGGVVVAFLLAVTVPTATVAALPLLYLRCALGDRPDVAGDGRVPVGGDGE